jgi:hypothetical protein
MALSDENIAATEMALSLAYNLTRVVNIIGVSSLTAASNTAKAHCCPLASIRNPSEAGMDSEGERRD